LAAERVALFRGSFTPVNEINNLAPFCETTMVQRNSIA